MDIAQHTHLLRILNSVLTRRTITLRLDQSKLLQIGQMFEILTVQLCRLAEKNYISYPVHQRPFMFTYNVSYNTALLDHVIDCLTEVIYCLKHNILIAKIDLSSFWRNLRGCRAQLITVINVQPLSNDQLIYMT
ncbi:hypothetical protein LCDV1gp038 [Lymphocystis disease virus 1]|uniref:hypothetical protein n=1 Tax=Fish lymphocystis disease virus TaxID=36363 RepID=UPI0000161EEE|nr:hypothetical protein LCDV1gp038 [Lymphocystis disease virus 1]